MFSLIFRSDLQEENNIVHMLSDEFQFMDSNS